MDADGVAELERSAHPELLRIGTTAAVIHGIEPARASVHAQPGWKLVVGRGGHVGAVTATGEAVQGPAIVVAPGVRHRAWSSRGYSAVLLDPGVLPVPPERAAVVALGTDQLGHVASALTLEFEGCVDELTGELLPALTATLGLRTGDLDGRVAEALVHLDEAPSVEAVAATVGSSPAHLRRLVQRELGVPLRRVRSWRRLRRAVLATGTLAAAAATAGFADQAHLARTARDLVGRTTTDVARSHAAGTPQRVTAPDQPSRRGLGTARSPGPP